MKRFGDLFSKIVDKENIRTAHINARVGKVHYHEVKRVDKDIPYYVNRIARVLDSGNFNTSEYKIKDRLCGSKMRTIYKLPYFPDRIVQHAIMQVIEPLLTPTLIRDTFQSIKGRGTHDARKRVTKGIQDKDSNYILKFDIKKFYPSIDNELLRAIVRRKIKCIDTLVLLDNIIDSTVGLPIGNYSSQILGNLYLSELDHLAKEKLGVKFYFRYCDDVVVMCKSKEDCIKAKEVLFKKVNDLRLKVKEDWQIYPTAKRDLDFVGWVFNKNYIKVRKSTIKNFKRKVKAIKVLDKPEKNPVSCVMSYWGIFKYVNNKLIWGLHVNETIKLKTDSYFKQNPLRR